MAKIDSIIETLTKLAHLGVLQNMSQKEVSNEKGESSSSGMGNIIDSIQSLFNSEDITALWQLLKIKLKTPENKPDVEVQIALSNWFGSLEDWQKIQLQARTASIIKLADGSYDEALEFLRMLYEIGKKNNPEAITKYCLDDGIITADEKGFQNMMKSIKSFAKKTRNEIEEDFGQTEHKGFFYDFKERQKEKYLKIKAKKDDK